MRDKINLKISHFQRNKHLFLIYFLISDYQKDNKYSIFGVSDQTTQYSAKRAKNKPLFSVKTEK